MKKLRKITIVHFSYYSINDVIPIKMKHAEDEVEPTQSKVTIYFCYASGFIENCSNEQYAVGVNSC